MIRKKPGLNFHRVSIPFALVFDLFFEPVQGGITTHVPRLNRPWLKFGFLGRSLGNKLVMIT